MAAWSKPTLTGGTTTYSWLVLLADLGRSGDTGTNRGGSGSTGGEDGSLWLGVRGRGDLEVGSIKLSLGFVGISSIM